MVCSSAGKKSAEPEPDPNTIKFEDSNPHLPNEFTDSVISGLGAVTGLGSVAANLVSNSSNVKLAREQRA